MTVLEMCAVLDIGDGVAPRIELSFGASGVPFNPKNSLEMMAYGDFLVDSCHVSDCGVNLVLMQQFVRKGGVA